MKRYNGGTWPYVSVLALFCSYLAARPDAILLPSTLRGCARSPPVYCVDSQKDNIKSSITFV